MRTFGIRVDLVAGEDLIHLLAKRLLHVDADGVHLLRNRLKVGLHQKRLGTAVELLPFRERRELRPNGEFHLWIRLAVILKEREVVAFKLSALAAARVFLDILAVVIYAEVAYDDIRLPFKRRLVLGHVAEATLLVAAHRVEVDAASGVAEVANLVLAWLVFLEHLLELRRVRLFRTVGKPKSVRYRVADTCDLYRVGRLRGQRRKKN